MLDDVSDVESEESEEEEDVDAVVGDEETVAKAKNILTNSWKMAVTVSELFFEKAAYAYI